MAKEQARQKIRDPQYHFDTKTAPNDQNSSNVKVETTLAPCQAKLKPQRLRIQMQQNKFGSFFTSTMVRDDIRRPATQNHPLI